MTTTRPVRRCPEVVTVRKVRGAEEADQTCTAPWGWSLMIHPRDHSHHIVPTWDIRQHWLDDKCGCCPELDEHGQMSHNSFDGRERYERGAPLN